MRPPIEYIKQKNSKNLLIFIHGFTSDSNTWCNSSDKALPEMLMEEDFIKENFDIAYFNYFTELSDFKKTRLGVNLVKTIFGGKSEAKKNVGIKSLSDHLKSSIDIYCDKYENIILIAHSMGGLVSKSYILEELEEYDNTKVKLFISLAVPHKGSGWASMGAQLFKGNPQVIDLEPLSDFLDKVNNNWIQQKNTLPKTIYYYGQFDEVVLEKNAISFQVEKQLKVACNSDHFNICKPEDKTHIVYQGIKKDLSSFIKEQQYIEDMKPKPFVDDGQLDDEFFVLKLLIADIHNHLIKDSKETFFEAEYMMKALTSAGYKLDELNQLYRNIERLYHIYFVKFVEGNEIKSSNDLVAKIFENIIEKDKQFLKTAIPFIDANKKTGMLSQLANDMEKDIWWAKNQSIKDIDEFRKAKEKNAK